MEQCCSIETLKSEGMPMAQESGALLAGGRQGTSGIAAASGLVLTGDGIY
jgi:hypothetical protein